jgi:hypothetical protein
MIPPVGDVTSPPYHRVITATIVVTAATAAAVETQNFASLQQRQQRQRT